jgi:hypothetical protein
LKMTCLNQSFHWKVSPTREARKWSPTRIASSAKTHVRLGSVRRITSMEPRNIMCCS